MATSSAPDGFALKSKHHDIFKLFPKNTIITGDMVIHGKPNPDIFIKAAISIKGTGGRMTIESVIGDKPDLSHCLVIEDSPIGITVRRIYSIITTTTLNNL